jgi:hypothetical protein
MALYRHTSMGFLGEFASNPGAGYTAISTMPTDTIANRVAWWRGLDTFGQTSSWHPSVYRSAQDPSEATISIQFTQEAALISADPDGTVTNPRDPGNTYYLGAATEVRVYRGITDVTVSEGWTLTKVEEGCTSSLTQTGGVYTLKITNIPLVATQSGFVRVTASRVGSGDFVKDFRFLKVFQGQDGVNGSSGLVIDLDNENHTVATNADGTGGVYSTAVSTVTVYEGATDVSHLWSFTITAGAGVTITRSNPTGAASTQRTATVTAMTSDAGIVTFSATRTGYPTLSAVFTISKAKAGVASTSTATLTAYKRSATTPTDTPGNVVYTFATAAWTPSNGWGKAIPSGTDPIWAVVGTAYGLEGTDTVQSTDWTSPVKVSEDGADGLNTATLYLYQRTDSTTAPTRPSGAYTYNFTTKALTADGGTVTNGWLTTLPTTTGGYLWAIVASAASVTETDSIPSSEWTTPQLLTVDGLVFDLDPSVSAIKRDKTGAITPTSITFSAYRKSGSQDRVAHAGFIKIETQAASLAWAQAAVTASAATSLTLSSIPAGTLNVRGTLYKESGMTTVLDSESVPIVADGADGSSGLVMDLDNENQTVAAQKDGAWIAGTTATTTARLYLGATQLTSGITWSVLSATSGITYSQTNNTSSFTVTVTNMTAALVTGSITLRAVYNGVNYDQVFTISKANAGSDGTPATVFWLTTSASAIAKAKTGTYNPTSITLNAYSQTGTGAVLAYTGRFRVETQATLNGAWTARYNSLGNEASASYTIPASIVAVRVILFQAGGTTTLLDQETLPVVADGQDGLQGTRGSRQIVLSGTSWTDAAAWNGIIAQFGGTTPVLSDLVTIANAGTGFSVSKFYSGGVFDGDWTEPTAYINGNLLVTGTVGANQIAANAITAGKIAAGAVTAAAIAADAITADKIGAGTITGKTIILSGVSSVLQSTNYVAGSAGWAIKGDGVAEFSAASIRGTLTADKISGGTLNASLMTVTNLSASSITTGTLNGTNVSVTNLNATNITTGTLNGVRVGSGVDGGNINDLSITSAKIASLNAGKIATGSLSAAVIDLVGSGAVIKTSNFAVGTGFRIAGDGSAFFYGSAVSGSARSTNWNGTVNGTTGQPVAGTGSVGWCIDNAGNAEFNTVMVRTRNIEGGAVTDSAGYGAPTSTPLGNGASGTFWAPTRPAVTYGRGRIAFVSRLTMRKTVSGDANRISGFIQISRNGSVVRGFNFGGGTGQDTLNVPIVYIDDSAISSALNYSFTLTNSTVSGITIEQIDQFWVEYKR